MHTTFILMMLLQDHINMKWKDIIKELREVQPIHTEAEKYAQAIREITHDPIVMSSLEGVYRGSGVLKRSLKQYLTHAVYDILKTQPDSDDANCEVSRLLKHLAHHLAPLKDNSDPIIRRYGEVANAMNTELRIRVVQAIMNRQPIDIQTFVSITLKDIVKDCAEKKFFICALTNQQ